MAEPARHSSDRWLYALAGALALVGLFHLGVFVADDRPWGGPVSWRKPFAFGVSFGLTLATIVWVTRRLRVRARPVLLWIFAADCVVEVGGITLQAWRDEPSHLNRSTPTNTAIAVTLAIGGAVLIVTLGAFAIAALRGRVDGPPSTVLAYRVGFFLLLCGLASGAAMIAVGTVAMNTGTPAHAYAVTGFLKAFHAATLHGVLVLPGAAWLLERLTANEAVRRRAVLVLSAGYLVLAVCLLVVAL